MLESENAVVKLSKSQPFNFRSRTNADGDARVQVITEGKIKEALIEEMGTAEKGDTIKMAMFYLAEHQILEELVKASERGAKVQIILDANKDAFGIEKNGVPNRPVAYKLLKGSKGKIEIRWYNTHGEQFHSKLTIFNKGSEVVLIGGSANLTRRNINDYNLESNLRVILPNTHPEAKKVNAYFDRLWNNEGAEYTLDFDAYGEKSLVKRVLYEVQERAGLSSF